jgi:hypothetical protein
VKKGIEALRAQTKAAEDELAALARRSSSEPETEKRQRFE